MDQIQTRSIFFTVGLFVMTVVCGPLAYGQTPTPTPFRRPMPTPTPSTARDNPTRGTLKDSSRKGPLNLSNVKSGLPDLYVYHIYPPYEWGPDTYRIRVAIRNVGNEGFESSNVRRPISVWLRVWRPIKGKPLTDEPAENTFVWGGVLTVPDGLKAGEMKEVIFLMPKPPGGWPSVVNAVSEPLYTRWNATVDPKNAIKETNETNNRLIR